MSIAGNHRSGAITFHYHVVAHPLPDNPADQPQI
jgi:hypothetical protein